jgi:23S rRNA pseudouridine1911/1915/1917 synthase
VDGLKVLYEDNHLLVVDKPVNIPVQADASGDIDLLTMGKAYIKERYAKPGEVFLGLVHRLDRPVGGVVAFARTSKAAARLSEQLRTRDMSRGYLCIVRGAPPTRGTLVHWLLKDEKNNTSRVVPEGTPGAKRAELSYETLESLDGLSLLSVHLMTGRSHQIRVQFASQGHALWGDARYGGGKPGEQIALHAASLTLTHPTTRARMTFRSEIPTVFPWSLCKRCVSVV